MKFFDYAEKHGITDLKDRIRASSLSMAQKNLAIDTLAGYTIYSVKSVRMRGICKPGKRLIGINPHLLQSEQRATFHNTFRHEAAHALQYVLFDRGAIRNGRVERMKPHGKEWKQMARMLGAVPKATSQGLAGAEANAVFREAMVSTRTPRPKTHIATCMDCETEFKRAVIKRSVWRRPGIRCRCGGELNFHVRI